MAWRSNQGEGITHFSFYDRSNSLHDSSRCHPSALYVLGEVTYQDQTGSGFSALSKTRST